MQAQVIEGTWEEVREETARLAREHVGERVRLIILPEARTGPAARAADTRHFYWRATPEEFARALDAIAAGSAQPTAHAALSPEEKTRLLDELAERNRGLPALPPEAFEREFPYDDR